MIKLTDFALRHFKTDFKGTKITDRTPEQFEHDLNYSAFITKIIPGYADFCKLLVYENWTNAKAGTTEITPEIYPLIKTAYEARRSEELPVLTRWVEGIEAPVAKYLVIVIYSKEQILKEEPESKFDADSGVVAILGQMHDEEEPMTPITMMRNALGISEGGSGHPLDREKYQKSVEFWSNHIMIKG